MSHHRSALGRRTVATLVAAVFAGAALTAMADMPPEHPHHGMGLPPTMEDMKEHLHRHLDKIAARLEIKASQQAAWSAYAQAIESMPPPKPPAAPDGDAAAITRMHAERAADMAQRLAVVADATAALQKVLDPDQRKTLDQIVRQHAVHMHRPPHHGGPHWGDRPEHAEGRSGPGAENPPPFVAERDAEDD